MQTQTEQDLDLAVSPTAVTEELDTHLTSEEADVIFQMAEAEIKPLLRKMRRETFVQNMLEVFCWIGILGSIIAMIYQTITYPHTLVVLFTKAQAASVTATLDLPTRTLAPVTITRSATRAATGTGYQKARAATGTLTFYNGLLTSQTVPTGTVLTGSDGVQVSTDRSVTIPAANPPQEGEATINATAIRAGSISNIHSGDINTAVSSSLLVKNLAAFTGGRDARTFRAVAPQDRQTLTTTINATLTQAFTTAFSLQPGEEDVPTNCHGTTSANHQPGEEAQSVTLTASETCSAIAYNQNELTRAAAAAFTKTRPGAQYHLVGSLQTTLQTVSPLTVSITGKWAYTFSQDYQQLLAEGIQGESPARAKAYLLKTGVISYASIPAPLPSAEYITFLVLVG
jgi:hypothetical protein